ncbi:leucine-rich repeat domain-containing protein [Paenibacillus senegalensis]|uniref:leucine-rich repeat domain-containing protein n=1 Tax=Paenibacillus senegalensis TaxID=1465766 RepID=UPI0002892F0A|nr:leucine-rich repeat domain-containing protein [Paenibacillus senegalensis]
MELIELNCPNCNGSLEYNEEPLIQCPYCETKLLLKENKVFYIDQSTHYYGTSPAHTAGHPAARPAPRPNTKVQLLLIAPLVLITFMVAYFFVANPSSNNRVEENIPVRTMPESEVVRYFLRDVLNKGEAMPTEEEIANIRYLAVHHTDDRWHFVYSFDDPFTNKQAKMTDYVIMDKVLNMQKIEQKDFEAFSGLTALDFNGVYEIVQSEKVSFRHLQGLQSYSGGFNESFSSIQHYFSDKSKITGLTTQIRSNEELAALLEFPNLQSLNITYVTESVTDFHLLGQLPLKSLSLQFVTDLKWLSALTGLESLTIDNSEATDFSGLYALTQLQELKLLYTRNLKTLDFIANMPNLQSLEIEQADIASLENLKNKTSLTKLRLAWLSPLESVEVVNSLPSLTELVITGYSGANSPIAAPNVKKAELTGSLLTNLEAPGLKALQVTVNGAMDELQGASLMKFPQLEELAVIDGELADIPSLNLLPKLQTLSFNEVSFYDETNALFNLQHVKTINCNKCTFRLQGQEPFANNALEHLTLNQLDFRIGDSDWLHDFDKLTPYFANMTALRSFTMQDSSLQSLSFMKNWEQVEELHLENNTISNLEPLVHLPNLQKLYIVGNPVQNESVLDKRVLIY